MREQKQLQFIGFIIAQCFILNCAFDVCLFRIRALLFTSLFLYHTFIHFSISVAEVKVFTGLHMDIFITLSISDKMEIIVSHSFDVCYSVDQWEKKNTTHTVYSKPPKQKTHSHRLTQTQSANQTILSIYFGINYTHINK